MLGTQVYIWSRSFGLIVGACDKSAASVSLLQQRASRCSHSRQQRSRGNERRRITVFNATRGSIAVKGPHERRSHAVHALRRQRARRKHGGGRSLSRLSVSVRPLSHGCPDSCGPACASRSHPKQAISWQSEDLLVGHEHCGERQALSWRLHPGCASSQRSTV